MTSGHHIIKDVCSHSHLMGILLYTCAVSNCSGFILLSFVFLLKRLINTKYFIKTGERRIVVTTSEIFDCGLYYTLLKLWQKYFKLRESYDNGWTMLSCTTQIKIVDCIALTIILQFVIIFWTSISEIVSINYTKILIKKCFD